MVRKRFIPSDRILRGKSSSQDSPFTVAFSLNKRIQGDNRSSREETLLNSSSREGKEIKQSEPTFSGQESDVQCFEHPSAASSSFPSSFSSVEDFLTGWSSSSDPNAFLNRASSDQLKLLVQQLLYRIQQQREELKELKDQHDAARETALSATDQVQQLKMQWEEHKCAPLEMRKKGTREELTEKYQVLYKEYQSALQANSQLQELCATFEYQLTETTSHLRDLTKRCDDYATRENSVNPCLIENNKLDIIEENTNRNDPTCVDVPPQLPFPIFQVSPLRCLMILPPVLDHSEDERLPTVVFLEKLLIQCDEKILKEPSESSVCNLNCLRGFRKHCERLLTFLTSHPRFTMDPELLKEFISYLEQCLPDWSDRSTLFLLEDVILTTLACCGKSSSFPGCISFLSICLLPFWDSMLPMTSKTYVSSFGCGTWSPLPEDSSKSCDVVPKPHPQSLSTENPPCVPRNHLNSDAALELLNELLIILNTRISKLSQGTETEDLDTIASRMISALETVEERFDASQQHSQLSATLRQLFFNTVDLLRRDSTLQKMIQDMTSQQSLLLETIQDYHSMFQRPPSEEQLFKARVDSEIHDILPVQHPRYTNLFVVCIELTALKSSCNGSPTTDLRCLWTPGLYFWPLDCFEQDPFWSKKIHQKNMSRQPLTEKIQELTEALRSHDEQIHLLTREREQLIFQFQEYKKKVAAVLNDVQAKLPILVSKEVQCSPDNRIPSPSPRSKQEECNVVVEQQENETRTLKNFLRDQDAQIEELKMALEFRLNETQGFDRVVNEIKQDFQASLKAWNNEKDNLIAQINTANQRVQLLIGMLSDESNQVFGKIQNCTEAQSIDLSRPPLVSQGNHDKEETCEDHQNARPINTIQQDQVYGNKPQNPLSPQEQWMTTDSKKNDSVQCSLTIDSPLSSALFAAPVKYITRIRQLLQAREHQLEVEQAEKSRVEQELATLKVELRKCTALLGLQPFMTTNVDEELHVPIAFVRQAVFRFMLTGYQGSCEHESLIPVLASLFSFTSDEVKQINDSRRRNAPFSRWLPTLS